MKATQTIFNPDLGVITIPIHEYERLLQYKELCREFREIMEGDRK